MDWHYGVWRTNIFVIYAERSGVLQREGPIKFLSRRIVRCIDFQRVTIQCPNSLKNYAGQRRAKQ